MLTANQNIYSPPYLHNSVHSHFQSPPKITYLQQRQWHMRTPGQNATTYSRPTPKPTTCNKCNGTQEHRNEMQQQQQETLDQLHKSSLAIDMMA
jgi:hypothetical protein